MKKTLFEKVWQKHAVRELPDGSTQLLVGTHLLHEVTSPQAFGMLRTLKLGVKYPQRTFATVDHIIPTDNRAEPYKDATAYEMLTELRKNCKDNGITFFDVHTGAQGVIHIVAPEQGLIHPGMTVACGDSHTATHGAFGAIAFGIGTSQVRNVLATQTLAFKKLKVRRVNVNGKLRDGVYPKDVALHIIRKLGVNGGIGYAYEFGGQVFDDMSMEGRMTVCNMAIEGGARIGYVNPDEKTFEYLRNRPYAPKGEEFEKAIEYWKTIASDEGCQYDDVVDFNGEDIEPTVTWGVNPSQAIFVSEKIPNPATIEDATARKDAEDALAYMGLAPETPIAGTKIDVAFIGSCTNGRLSDFVEAAKYLKGKKVAEGVKALAVPGSQIVDKLAREMGLNKVFEEAGFQWREAGCSMCLAMNPDKLVGRQLCASTSNRNFKGRQGSPTGRTVLMSPLMVAAAAVKGEITMP
ncbi:MAG: 3-isopropylmalate dehydratase large subunit [Verrucomicrobiaceae bacterium]|nr:3-isopropylmalate dehydratase large subunit [Verrucomicrobiaceae bacterium]